MQRTLLVVTAAAVALAPADLAADRPVDKQVIITISRKAMDNGVLSQLAWDNGVLILQGAVADASGQLSPRYFVVPADGISLKALRDPTQRVLDYWKWKSRRVSPSGLGTIVSGSDSQVPMNALGGLESTLSQAADMGGMQTRYTLKLGSLLILSRSGLPSYDGETYSWSPAAQNRIAYVDGKGDLWIAAADGRKAVRVLRGNFTLPAWSEEGRSIAVAERKDAGTWQIVLVHLPEELR